MSIMCISLFLSVLLHKTYSDIASIYQMHQLMKSTQALEMKMLSDMIELEIPVEPMIEKRQTLGKSVLQRTLFYQLSKTTTSLYRIPLAEYALKVCKQAHETYMAPTHPLITKQGSTAVSTYTCKEREFKFSEEKLKIRSNYETQSFNQLEKSSLFFVSGYLYIKDLNVLEHLVIIAGGSIVIEEIRGTPTTQLSLISLTGDISVARSSQINSVYIDAYQDTEIPLNLRNRKGIDSIHVNQSSGWVRGYSIPSR